MEESAPAPAAQNENAAPQETAAKSEKPQGKRWRLHVPTSVIVTLLVAAVSVWVAPAFTRQWEDRKQARQLQAQVAEDMALATADLGQRINSFARTQNLKGRRISTESQSVQDYWQIRQARIDARLRAYFSTEMRSAWLTFNEVVERAIELVKEGQYVASGAPADVFRPAASINLQEITRLGRTFGLERPFAHAAEFDLGVLIGEGGPLVSSRERAVGNLVIWMRGIEDKIIDQVMTEDPEAFSTTRRDLLRDLLP
jgi:hypothetical protein